MTGEKITEQNNDMRVLITYKGSAEIGKEFQDDYILLEVIEKFARKRGYAAIYINSIRQDRRFLDKEKFIEVSGRTMAKKDVSR